jgi:hypothetical protein
LDSYMISFRTGIEKPKLLWRTFRCFLKRLRLLWGHWKLLKLLLLLWLLRILRLLLLRILKLSILLAIFSSEKLARRHWLVCTCLRRIAILRVWLESLLLIIRLFVVIRFLFQGVRSSNVRLLFNSLMTRWEIVEFFRNFLLCLFHNLTLL